MRPARKTASDQSLILRVADLVAAPQQDVRRVVDRIHPATITSHLAETAAGTLVTLEVRVRPGSPFRRRRAIRNLQRSLFVIQRELECPSVPTTSDRPE